jgi:hypothetical protein
LFNPTNLFEGNRVSAQIPTPAGTNLPTGAIEGSRGFTTVHSSKPEGKFSCSNVWVVTDETTVISVASANRHKLAVFCFKRFSQHNAGKMELLADNSDVVFDPMTPGEEEALLAVSNHNNLFF